MMAPLSRPACSGLLFPVLVFLGCLASNVRSFSHNSAADVRVSRLPSASTVIASRKSCRRRGRSRRWQHLQQLGTLQHNHQQSVCWATLEHPHFSAPPGEDDGSEEYHAAMNGVADGSHDTNGHLHQNHHEYDNNGNNHNNHNRQHQPNRKNGKPMNAAMADTAFLRKRTEKFLALPVQSAADEPTISSRGMKVDRKTFHFLIDAWAFSGEMDAADQALALLHKMEELYEGQQQQQEQDYNGDQPSSNIQPDVRSYTKVINAISRTATPHAGELAEEILDKMINMYESGQNLQAKPNTFTYTAVVEAHANSGIPGSAQCAEEICEMMVQKYINGEDDDVRPTSRCYNAAINAYAKSGDSGAAERAEAFVQRMEELYQATGLEEIRPNSYNYNSLISAWANCGEAGAVERAEEVLGRMETLYHNGNHNDVKPSTVSYNAVIDAYSKCDGLVEEYDTAAGERAENLLYHMKGLYESGENVDAKPNVRSYNTVINVWAKSPSEDGARRAEDVLELMKQLAEEGDTIIQPDVHSFSTVINAWARSNEENKAERALNLLKEMTFLSKQGNKKVHPNVVVANAVMNACAYTVGGVPERNRAMEIAHKVFKAMEAGEYGRPDQVTYGTFLQVCTNQMPECSTRDQIIGMIFQKCCSDGQVGNLVLQHLKSTISPELFYELVGMDIESIRGMEDLPVDWCGNVVEGKWRRRRNF